ncbi:unnamed protein product [Thelazia callipaeda]|uniref:Epithelial membrane protein 2 n=1 Tax=Thelazia callipaeda TaxID=103827 RepID=A0A0N5CSK5_THECL|nr:unnamed protein product [Thelazia callipaeda]
MSSQVSRTWASVSRTGICHSSFTSHKQKYLWVCSLIHSRIIFFAVQILLIVLSFVTFGYASFIPVKSVNEKGCWIVLAYISLIGFVI